MKEVLQRPNLRTASKEEREAANKEGKVYVAQKKEIDIKVSGWERELSGMTASEVFKSLGLYDADLIKQFEEYQSTDEYRRTKKAKAQL